MKNILFATFVLLASAASAQHFKNDYVVNGIAYKASVNEDMHVTYIQQDNFDFPLAADSLYIDVMTAQQWDAYSDLIIAQEGATEPPAFLNGFRYATKQMVDDDGLLFTIYVISDDEFIEFKKSIMKYPKHNVGFGKDGLLFVNRLIDGYEVMSARGFNFKQFYIYEE